MESPTTDLSVEMEALKLGLTRYENVCVCACEKS